MDEVVKMRSKSFLSVSKAFIFNVVKIYILLSPIRMPLKNAPIYKLEPVFVYYELLIVRVDNKG